MMGNAYAEARVQAPSSMRAVSVSGPHKPKSALVVAATGDWCGVSCSISLPLLVAGIQGAINGDHLCGRVGTHRDGGQ